MNAIGVVLADSQPLTLCGLRSAVADEDDIQVLAECTDIDGMQEAVRTFLPQVLLVCTDILGEEFDLLPGMKKVSQHTRVLLLTSRKDSEFLESLLRRGVSGVFQLEAPVQYVPRAIRTVNQGGLWFERSVTERMLGDLLQNGNGKGNNKTPPVSAREQEVIELICQGLRNKEVSERLHISEATVSHHLTSIFRKLEVEDRVSLVIHAVRNHLVSL